MLHELKFDNATRDDCVLKMFSVAKFAGDSLEAMIHCLSFGPMGERDCLPHI